jgi:RNA polymerase sigma-70 factor, ECF subfamily
MGVMPESPTKENVNSGRMDEFASLLGRHQRQIYLYILSILPRPVDAEDVLQDTNVVLWEKFEQYQPGALFTTWACGIAHFKVLQHLQKNRRRPVLLDTDLLSQLAKESAEFSVELDAEQRWLAKCLAKLPPEDRKLILQRYEPGATGKSVAALLGRPANSVYKSLSRIRRTLLKCVRRATNEERQP